MKYKIPTIKEIAALDWNGYNVASTFSGCGGSSLGYRMAGFRVLYANEFVQAARDCYKANCADYTYVDPRDIRTVTGSDILEKINLGAGELDILDGSPPCASFSMAGSREKGWGKVKKYSDTKQRTDDLFFEFARILKEIQPKTFIAENVAGLAMGSAKDLLGDHQMDMFGAQNNTILHTLMDCGYRVWAEILNAAELGVPQARRRLIFIGVRRDLNKDPVYPKPFPYQFTVRDAIEDCIKLPEDKEFLRLCKSYFKEYDNIEQGKSSDKYLQMSRLSFDKPSSTVTCNVRNICHPEEKRNLSIDELKRICSFPEDFELQGSYTKQGERLGRSVPPLMMKAIAQTIKEKLLDDLKHGTAPPHEVFKANNRDIETTLVDSNKNPAPTITAGGGDKGAGMIKFAGEIRKFTIEELKRICAFPDDFKLLGSFNKQWERLGRSVPPLMMKAISSTVRDQILCAE